MNQLKQVAIALDQLASTLIPPWTGVYRGWADETLSSRAWRHSSTSEHWKRIQTSIDWVFKHVFRETDHCFESWVSESLRNHLPPEFRTNTPDTLL